MLSNGRFKRCSFTKNKFENFFAHDRLVVSEPASVVKLVMMCNDTIERTNND